MRTRVEELFHDVADLSAEARTRYFAEQGVDDATRREVEVLLEFDTRSHTALDRDIRSVAQGTLERFDSKDTHCGAYQLGDLLGRGGMGAVYAAERVDGEVTQRVAVKLLRPGVDDPHFRQRFLAERQILATLSHANIARLLDAGHRDDGQPYLVMEYVAGKPIDEYTAGQGIRQKISLFLKVCAAVGYLHRNLVVHRDLKPANILVTAEGEPKLLDFGIAKILDLSSDRTMTGMRMLTPDYASPEQAAGAPMTTATDIYSLGAVLYKVLTGSSPHQFTNESVGAMALAIFDGKITSPAKLLPALRGDLEMIVMKALRREPQERYATIEQFADDLENYLESRPIRARKGDAWYRTRKFVRRYWIPVAAAALAISGLAAGLALANRERALAERRFVDVRQLANKLFDIDEQVARLPGGTQTRQFIVDTSLEYLRRVTADVRMEPELALEIGTAYMRVARVQRVDILGQTNLADGTEEKAQALIDSVLASQPGNRVALLRAAQIAQDRMLIARHRHPEAAFRFAQQAAARLEQYLKLGNPAGKLDRAEAQEAILVHLNVANEYVRAQRFEEAIGISRRAIEIGRATNWPLYAGGALLNVAAAYRATGKLDDALVAIRESVRILEPPPGEKSTGRPLAFISALINEGQILGEREDVSLNRPDEAVERLQRAADVAEDFARRDPHEFSSRERVFSAAVTAANILRDTDPRRALEFCNRALQRLGEIQDHAGARLHEVEALAAASYALQRLGRSGEARHRLDSAFDRLRQVKSYPAEKIRPRSEPAAALAALGDYEASNGNIPQAIARYEELLQKERAGGLKPDTSLADAVDVSRIFTALSELHRRARQLEEASAYHSRQLELWQQWDARLPHNNFVIRQHTTALALAANTNARRLAAANRP